MHLVTNDGNSSMRFVCCHPETKSPAHSLLRHPALAVPMKHETVDEPFITPAYVLPPSCGN
jgi:hypothetical protein